MRMTPKISDSPLPTRNSNAPYEMPLKVWISQNCAPKISPIPGGPGSQLTPGQVWADSRGRRPEPVRMSHAAPGETLFRGDARLLEDGRPFRLLGRDVGRVGLRRPGQRLRTVDDE